MADRAVGRVVENASVWWFATLQGSRTCEWIAAVPARPVGTMPGMSLEFREILVPVDFTERCASAARDADALALSSGGRLRLLHVVAPAPLPITDPVPAAAVAQDDAKLLQQRREFARTWVDGLELTTPGDRVDMEVVEGAPADEIVEHTRTTDLVVIASHGRRGLSRWLLGSVAERVVRGAHCSTLVVKDADERES